MKKKNIQELPFFSRKLKTLRKDRGLEQIDLANALGVSRETVSYYENRAKNPTTGLVNKVASFFEVSPDVFISEVNPEHKKNKPGPVSKLEKQFKQVQHLPKEEQKFVSKFLDNVIADAK